MQCFLDLAFFHRGSIFKEGGSSLFLAFEVPASTVPQARLASCALSRGPEPQARA